MNNDAFEKIKAIYGLSIRNGTKIPFILNKDIAKWCIPIMYCQKCDIPLQTDYNKDKSISWNIDYTDNHQILCKKCTPSLQEAFEKRFKKMK